MKLLDDKSLIPHTLQNSIDRAPVSEGYCTVYLGLNRMPVWVYLLPLLGLEVALAVGLLAGGVPAMPFLAIAIYLACVMQRRRLKPRPTD